MIIKKEEISNYLESDVFLDKYFNAILILNLTEKEYPLDKYKKDFMDNVSEVDGYIIFE